MSTPSGWFAAQAKHNPDLFRVIYDFNLRPQHWVHPSVIEGLPHAIVVTALTASGRGSAHLSSWLMHQLQLDHEEPCWDFEEPRSRLALLHTATLQRLACYAGAAACWPQLAAAIGKDQCREIKTVLGDDAHVFALRRGRMVVPQTEPVPVNGPCSLGAAAAEAGWRMLLTAAHHERISVQRRIALKLPPSIAATMAAAPAATREARQQAWARLQKITGEVLSDGESKCFC